jgi:hypothetical protein
MPGSGSLEQLRARQGCRYGIEADSDTPRSRTIIYGGKRER